MKRVRAQSAPKRPAEILFDNPLKSTLKNDKRVATGPASNKRGFSALAPAEISVADHVGSNPTMAGSVADHSGLNAFQLQIIPVGKWR